MSPERNGRFTSSEIFKLMLDGKVKGTFGVKALTYIAEKNMERRLGRSLDIETGARPLSWGTLAEAFVFSKLGLEYKLCSNDTIVHPEIDDWAGSPDAETEDAIVDVKAPATLKAFCELVDPLYQGMSGEQAIAAIRENHEYGDKYYYQILSNAILRQKRYGELIVFAPYQSELQVLRELCQLMDGEGLKRFFWINNAADNELPFLPDGGYYKNINVVRFEIPVADKIALHKRVVEAGKMLITPKLIPA